MFLLQKCHFLSVCYLFTDSACDLFCLPGVSLCKLAQVAQVVECPLRGTGGHTFDPGPQHTKVVKHGTSCSSFGIQTYRIEL